MALSGRLALVTGGSSGIGEAVCHALAAEGATVVIANRNVDAARKVVESLPGDVEHLAQHVDIGDSSSVEKLFDNIRSAYTLPLSIVVNSAALFCQSLLVDTTDELFDDIIRVNLKGTFLVTRAACREMIGSKNALPEGGAAIVNIASIVARGGWANCGAYAACKAGVVALTKTAAQEMAHHGIRCNVVLPGYTETPMAHIASEEHRAALVAVTPLKRAAEPREVAEAIRFLCSPSASSFVTGAVLEVTGGLYM
ncbi:(3R)-3-hydroxyacyl-CoA dehydrogenase-like [Amblyomma americanum]